MNVVKIQGGLGNQMFQYAFGKLLPAPVFYDCSWFDAPGADRQFGLPGLAVSIHKIDCRYCQSLLSKKRFLGLTWRRPALRHVYESGVVDMDLGAAMKTPSFFEGYFQNAAWYESVRDVLRADFRLCFHPANAEYQRLKALIETTDSVSVHVRRGDYLKLQAVYAPCGEEYYRQAIGLVRERVRHPVFFVFSDDQAWAKCYFGDSHNVYFVELNDKPVLDLDLMTRCRHNIIANSTFSWWGAWLNENQNKVVVAPKRWFSDGRPSHIVPEGWYRI